MHHFEPIRALKLLFYVGGKRFQCPGPGNTLTLDYWKKDPLRTRVPEHEFLKRAFRTEQQTEPKEHAKPAPACCSRCLACLVLASSHGV